MHSNKNEEKGKLTMKIPQLGAGTFRLKGEDAFHSVTMALEAGYRHIDTAQDLWQRKRSG